MPIRWNSLYLEQIDSFYDGHTDAHEQKNYERSEEQKAEEKRLSWVEELVGPGCRASLLVDYSFPTETVVPGHRIRWFRWGMVGGDRLLEVERTAIRLVEQRLEERTRGPRLE